MIIDLRFVSEAGFCVALESFLLAIQASKVHGYDIYGMVQDFNDNHVYVADAYSTDNYGHRVRSLGIRLFVAGTK